MSAAFPVDRFCLVGPRASDCRCLWVGKGLRVGIDRCLLVGLSVGSRGRLDGLLVVEHDHGRFPWIAIDAGTAEGLVDVSVGY